MMHMRRAFSMAGLLACLLSTPGYSAESVAPRFPDTALPSPDLPESDVLSRQGQVRVTGRLLVSPCVLSDWAEEMQGEAWFASRTRQVTLALEGCGDGQVGPVLWKGAPVLAWGIWGDANERFRMRLNNGVNYLTLSAPQVAGLMPLEVTYE
ncbi:hypothetical protein F7396_20120 [Salmonella enterica]|nr:hypothetical protein [Salmonella enterica]ECD4514764.1 hypothetical protein [Salmonella enterica subsp. enterica serovar Sandiego]ECF1356162.1 hypothetical protein [Salmonella enterica subsp. enterica serovar Sandiego]ECV4068500.1 hypothetical protein [Salmonella enterica]ECZ0995776.1 hypothetical protein [Salmonella enterica]